MRHQYETLVSEWLVVEAIVRQQDIEETEAYQKKLKGILSVNDQNINSLDLVWCAPSFDTSIAQCK